MRSRASSSWASPRPSRTRWSPTAIASGPRVTTEKQTPRAPGRICPDPALGAGAWVWHVSPPPSQVPDHHHRDDDDGDDDRGRPDRPGNPGVVGAYLIPEDREERHPDSRPQEGEAGEPEGLHLRETRRERDVC